MNQLHEEPNEAHDGKSDSCGHGDLLELFSVWFSAALHQPHGVLSKLPRGLNQHHNLIHGSVCLGGGAGQQTR